MRVKHQVDVGDLALAAADTRAWYLSNKMLGTGQMVPGSGHQDPVLLRDEQVSFCPQDAFLQKDWTDIGRFGEPAEQIQATGVTHYLYPDKGLVVALHENSKEVIQYVHPARFEQLSQPLR